MPDELFRLPKKGFAAPLQLWMKSHYKNELKTMLDENLFDNDYFDSAYTRQLINDFITDKPVNESLIWYLFSFQKWYNKWNTD